MSRTVSSAHAAISVPSPSNLATLKALISGHKTLLADVRSSNAALEVDNARLAEELASLSPIQGERRRNDPGTDQVSAPSERAAGERLRWIENYVLGTLAQTIWALDVRAARLEAEVVAEDRAGARHLLELSHVAYDQIRSLLAELRGGAGA